MSGSSEVIAFGTLFLGIAIGGISVNINWKNRAQENWKYMVKFLDGGEVQRISKGED